MKDQQSYIFVSVVYLTYSSKRTSPDMTTIFQARLYGRSAEPKRNLIEGNKVPIFLEVVLAIEATKRETRF